MMFNNQYYNPYMQGYRQPYQPAPTPNSIIWVNGEHEAEAYPVAPNNAIALWDSSAPAIYLKQADAAGRTNLRAYALVEREEPKKEEDDYATQADMDAVIKTIAALKAEVECLKESGKKRKKGEEENE